MNQSDIVGPSEVIMPGSQQFLIVAALLLALISVVALMVGLLVRWRRRRQGRQRKRPIGTSVAGVVLAVAVVLGLWNRPSTFFVPEFPALPQLFDDGAFFYRSADDLEVTPDSAGNIGALGGLPLVPSAGSQVSGGTVLGRPFNLVDDSTPRHEFAFTYSEASDRVEYPITSPAYVESMPAYQVDNHYVGIDPEAGRMWELWLISNWFGRWKAGSGALWDLDSLDYAKGQTVAAGLPIFPLTFTYAEVEQGSIDHVLGVGSPVVGPDVIWPARASDGGSTDPEAPAMGTWFRLRSDVDLDGLGPQARVIAEAMRDHGMILGDTSGTFSVSGTPDSRWDEDDLATLRTLSTDDLEVVDGTAVMVSPDSMEARDPE